MPRQRTLFHVTLTGCSGGWLQRCCRVCSCESTTILKINEIKLNLCSKGEKGGCQMHQRFSLGCSQWPDSSLSVCAVSDGQPVLVLLDGTDCRAQGVYQKHPHAHTPISRGEDVREATRSFSLQIRLITFQRGPVNSPDRGCSDCT